MGGGPAGRFVAAVACTSKHDDAARPVDMNDAMVDPTNPPASGRARKVPGLIQATTWEGRGEHFWLLLGFAVLLGLMVLQTILSLRQMEQQRQQLESVIEVGLTKLDLVGRMHAAGRDRVLLLQRMFLTEDPFEREALREAFGRQAAAFIHARQRLLAMPLDATERGLLQQQSALSQRFHGLHLQVLDLLERGERVEATGLLGTELMPTQNAVLEVLNRLYQAQQHGVRAIWQESGRLQQKAKRLLLLVAALMLLIGVLVAYFVFCRVRAASRERERLASFDQLTGLPNRRLIGALVDQAIARAKRHGQKLAVMFVDLDRFKAVNDSLGHHAGDALLKEVAARLRAHVRSSDTVGRLAGDEFIVLLEDVHRVEEVERVADKLVQALQASVMIEGERVQVGASIGIALYPDHGRDRHQILQRADAAMYAVKDGGRNGHRIYGQVA